MSLRFASIVLLWLQSYIISNIFQIPKFRQQIALCNKACFKLVNVGPNKILTNQTILDN